ncbi:Flavonol reductase/cinnamoyl-CoA reductase [Handroanthus impetiginosus]|uniref:Dihydroflavonol 4-reductase n=1 Tax=Handroanthus impetiginosus TaxID=429701 RepID=A0A2G9HA41_9LAMI|nr:Flavonol reductase/cinnamoyl-CoA reductase [Handroanthus impetiginosus]
MSTVCVTGASGFLASWLVKVLLQRGYTVKASVRYPNDPKKTHHLLSLDGAKERLKLFKADLLEEGSFDPIVAGCDGVFHTASPFFFDAKDPQAELIDPALKGTLNVLRSVAKTPSVRRVVLTSSEAAVSFNARPRTPEVVVDETWFSDAEWCRQNQQTKFKSFIPSLFLNLYDENAWWISWSYKFIFLCLNCDIKNTYTSAETFPNATYGWVDIKDVVDAHILAFEKPEANGRYLMVERTAHFSEFVRILRELYPNFKLPEKCADDKPYQPTYQVSKERAKSLGVKFTPLEQSVKETTESLKEKGFLKPTYI